MNCKTTTFYGEHMVSQVNINPSQFSGKDDPRKILDRLKEEDIKMTRGFAMLKIEIDLINDLLNKWASLGENGGRNE